MGGGLSYSNKRFDLFFDACYVRAESTASSTKTNVTYHQSNVGVNGIYGGPGVNYKLQDSDIHLGLQLTALHREGDWDTPQNGNFRLEETSYTRFGYSFQTRWAVKPLNRALKILKAQRLSLFARFGKTFRNESSTYSMGIEFLL